MLLGRDERAGAVPMFLRHGEVGWELPESALDVRVGEHEGSVSDSIHGQGTRLGMGEGLAGDEWAVVFYTNPTPLPIFIAIITI